MHVHSGNIHLQNAIEEHMKSVQTSMNVEERPDSSSVASLHSNQSKLVIVMQE